MVRKNTFTFVCCFVKNRLGGDNRSVSRNIEIALNLAKSSGNWPIDAGLDDIRYILSTHSHQILIGSALLQSSYIKISLGQLFSLLILIVDTIRTHCGIGGVRITKTST